MQKLSDGLFTPISFVHNMTKQIDGRFEDGSSNVDEEVCSDDSELEVAAIQDRPLCPVCMDPAQVVNTTFIQCGHTNCFDCSPMIKMLNNIVQFVARVLAKL